MNQETKNLIFAFLSGALSVCGLLSIYSGLVGEGWFYLLPGYIFVIGALFASGNIK